MSTPQAQRAEVVSLGAAPTLRLRLGVFPGAALTAAAGALAVLALPPYSILLALPVAFSALYALLQGRRPAAAFALGYGFGLGYFGIGISWIAESFFIDAERFGWLAVPAVASLAAGLAIFPGLAAAVFTAFRVRGLFGAATFAACWMGAEWLRGHVLTGFPWNLAGYALADWDALRQPAAWIGSYGLSFLAVFAATIPVVMFGDRTRIGRLVPAAAFVVLVVGAWIAGQARLAAPAPAPPGVALRIVQGNVPQEDKWNAARRAEFVRRYLELSGRPGSFGVLLWPETAFPGYLDESPEALASIAARLPEGGVLLTGSPDREQVGGRTLYHNAIFAIDAGGRILAEYAKHHLVPFGEYVPFRGWLPIERLTEGLGDFASGPGPRTLAVGMAPLVGAAICYEAIFPGHVVDDAIRPDWIFNATNDAWFGSSMGPWQHLASARMRAVEEGLPMVRAANTGISAVIDALGRTQAQLGLGETGILDAPLPPALPRTLYAWAGDLTLPPLVLAALALAAVLDRAARRTGREYRRET
ncbi:apolipoprotein N-acyltransferase [Roseitranquillus sediminis]|uniref:apolipoprotein N-acyltransferase n=1 Tax=Roseitranquillus sediminis TaxID=2809051 RepID=UPI001D0CB7C8|nr:apolipoprotein N-acyltransferase [Roseitranquillus sediminis]MBM9595110.1 apolipoprotein N-acyltransferase [Roseitranquillus sediminis]